MNGTIFKATVGNCAFSRAIVWVLSDGGYVIAVLDKTGQWKYKTVDRQDAIELAFQIHAIGMDEFSDTFFGDAFIMTSKFFRSQATEAEWTLAALTVL